MSEPTNTSTSREPIVQARRPIRLLNRLWRIVPGAVPDLSLEKLVHLAERRSGCSDWAGGELWPFLERLLEDVESHGRLTPFGRYAFRTNLVEHLGARLEVVRALKQGANLPSVQRPVFVTGLYRTGTTLLHHLMGGLENARTPYYWQLRDPVQAARPETHKHLIRKTAVHRGLHRIIAPSFEDAHEIRAEDPEECLFLFENAGVSTMTFFLTEAKSYAWWLLEQDLRPAYRLFAQQLSVMQAGPTDQRWVLKWPYHLWHLDALLETFPDALVVHCHRRPQEAIPSVCSLAARARAPFCSTVDPVELGRFWLNYSAAGLARARTVRERVGESAFLDIDYEELAADPLSVVATICEHAQLEMTSDDHERLGEHLATRRARRRAHTYSAGQFDLGDKLVQSTFA